MAAVFCGKRVTLRGERGAGGHGSKIDAIEINLIPEFPHQCHVDPFQAGDAARPSQR
jgi:hypothetical protein